MNLIKIYRINNWYYYLGFIWLGYVKKFKYIDWNSIWLFIPASILLAYAFSLNDYYDKRLKKKFFLLPILIFPFTSIFLNWFQILISLFFLFIFTLYSHPLIRLKGRPIFSTLANSVGFSLLFLLGSSSLEFDEILLFFFFVLLNTPAQLIHEIVDYREDKKKRDFTTTVTYGINFSKNLSIYSFLLAIIISEVFYFQTTNILFFAATLIFVTYFCYKIKNSEINRGFRRNYRNFGIIMGVVYLFSFL